MLARPLPNELKLSIYKQPIHPELFDIFLDKKIKTPLYEADIRIIGLGHIISFYNKKYTITECLSCDTVLLSRKNLLKNLDLKRARTYKINYDNLIYYIMQAQKERISRAVFEHTYWELKKYSEKKGLYIEYLHWKEDEPSNGKGFFEGLSIPEEQIKEKKPPPFSFIDYTYRAKELNIFSYHGFPEENTIIKVQSVFSIEPIEEAFKGRKRK